MNPSTQNQLPEPQDFNQGQPTNMPSIEPLAADQYPSPIPPNMPAAPPPFAAAQAQPPNQPTPPYQPAQDLSPAQQVQVKAPIKANPNSTQNALQIAEVRDGIVIMNDGSYRSVIMVKSINFDLMSPQEREAVESSYQGFLNSLYFPIQIFIHSRKVDLTPYIQKLDKIRTEHENMLLSMLMSDYIEFMSQLSLQTNIMDKNFYIVIPYFPTIDVQKALAASKSLFSGLAALFNSKENHVTVNEDDLEKAKAELRNRVQSVLAGLLQCGIQGLPLDTQELIELYYDVYNPDTATRQELKNFDSLSVPVVTKGEGEARQPNLDRELQ
jgi:hypothetical protein